MKEKPLSDPLHCISHNPFSINLTVKSWLCRIVFLAFWVALQLACRKRAARTIAWRMESMTLLTLKICDTSFQLTKHFHMYMWWFQLFTLRGKAGMIIPILYMDKWMLERLNDDLHRVTQLVNDSQCLNLGIFHYSALSINGTLSWS
jgi:hypothetical protein